jgi:octaprenyl-diphosphate synthase
MTQEDIRALVATDMAAVDAVIRARLASGVHLVSQVAEHIVAGGGKRLRPLVVLLSAHAAAGRPLDGTPSRCRRVHRIHPYRHTAA